MGGNMLFSRGMGVNNPKYYVYSTKYLLFSIRRVALTEHWRYTSQSSWAERTRQLNACSDARWNKHSSQSGPLLQVRIISAAQSGSARWVSHPQVLAWELRAPGPLPNTKSIVGCHECCIESMCPPWLSYKGHLRTGHGVGVPWLHITRPGSLKERLA